ncbi:MAG: sugar transferase [Lachnospiraceae bacterium]|nr:sugar transferase [Lachnospiraceae bacterium]
MYERAKNRWFKHFDFIILDLLVIELAYLFACYLRMKNSWYLFTDLYRTMRVLILLLDGIIICTIPVHKNILKRKVYQEFLESIKNITVLVVAMMLYLYFMQKAYFFSRSVFITFWICACGGMCLVRIGYKQIVRSYLLKHGRMARMLLIADAQKAEKTLKRLERHSENRFKMKAVLLVNSSDDRNFELENYLRSCPDFSDIVFFNDLDELYTYMRNGVIDEAIIDLSDNSLAEEMVHNLMVTGLTVHINLAHTFGNLPNEMVEKVGGLTVLTSSVSVASPAQLLLKRMMDIAGSLVGLMITAVAFVIFAPIIYIQSPGPIFYSQVRIGKNGRKFKIYKFRSMYPDADKRKAELMAQNKMEGLMFKIDNDPRIIPIGRLMRKLSIDELPQFYNILKGDMSLVGTRPPTVDEWEQYSPHHRARLCSKPGLTGMWQVSGRSDITNFEEVVALDLKYIREWNLWLDIKLLFKTVQVVLMGKGSV